MSWIAVAAAPAPAAGEPTLRSVFISFDTSARSSPPSGTFPVTVVVEGLRGRDRFTLADAEIEVVRDVATPFVLELTPRSRVRKADLDQVVTSVSTDARTPDRFVFHYTLTLRFEGGDADDDFLQKTYAVQLGAARPLAMTQTDVRRPTTTTAGATDSAAVPRAMELAYAELEAAYAQMEESIDRNRGVRAPIWMHYTLGSLVLEGDQAVIEVRQSFSRMERHHGELHKVETGVTRDETWVKTRRGWKRRSAGDERDVERYVDGRPVEPGAEPQPVRS